jgi:hypothetical protein
MFVSRRAWARCSCLVDRDDDIGPATRSPASRRQAPWRAEGVAGGGPRTSWHDECCALDMHHLLTLLLLPAPDSVSLLASRALLDDALAPAAVLDRAAPLSQPPETDGLAARKLALLDERRQAALADAQHARVEVAAFVVASAALPSLTVASVMIGRPGAPAPDPRAAVVQTGASAVGLASCVASAATTPWLLFRGLTSLAAADEHDLRAAALGRRIVSLRAAGPVDRRAPTEAQPQKDPALP